VLRQIQSYIDVSGFPPAIRCIAEAMNINSSRGVTAHLDSLERKGYLKRTMGMARALSLTPKGLQAVEIGQRTKPDRHAVVITIEFEGGQPIGHPWALSDIADAVQKDYFNYAGATSTAEIRGAG